MPATEGWIDNLDICGNPWFRKKLCMKVASIRAEFPVSLKSAADGAVEIRHLGRGEWGRRGEGGGRRGISRMGGIGGGEGEGKQGEIRGKGGGQERGDDEKGRGVGKGLRMGANWGAATMHSAYRNHIFHCHTC